MCGAQARVCFGPKADIASFDHLVGANVQIRRNVNAKCLRSPKIDDQLKF